MIKRFKVPGTRISSQKSPLSERNPTRPMCLYFSLFCKVCVHMCVHVSSSAAAAVQLVLTSSLTHTCRTQENIRVFLCYSPPYSLEAGSLSEHGVLPFCWRAWLANKLLPLPSNTGTAGTCGYVLLLCRCWGSQLRVSFLYNKCSYPRVTCPAPTVSFLTLPLSMEIVPPRILV